MDFLLELLVQFVVEFVVETIGDYGFRGTRRLAASTVGRCLLGGTAGLGLGLAWGTHLSGGLHQPKLLWVSLVLAAAAAAGLVWRLNRPLIRDGDLLRELLVPPWQWPAQRLIVFVVINLGVAGGIACAFTPGQLPPG